MSGNIDNRIVAIEFDNKQFEQEIRNTAASLRSFEADLDRVGATTAAEGIEELSNRFTTMKTIGMMAFADLTSSAVQFGTSMVKNVISKMMSAGKQRSLNIQQAKFMLKGMGADVEATMKSALDAVSGTAYGLDAAASAAARFGGAGIKAGDQMTGALRGVAGVAAMSASSFEEIADVFSEAAAGGYVTGNTVARMQARSFDIVDPMAKALGKSQEEVKQMIKDREITFAQFAAMMDDAFGSSAKKANETYAGALANIGSALGRIGAVFMDFRLEAMRRAFNALIPLIDAVKTALEPVMFMYGLLMSYSGNKIESMVGKLIGIGEDGKASEQFVERLRDAFTDVAFAIAAVIRTIHNLASAFAWQLGNVFGGEMGGLKSFPKMLKEVAERLELSKESAQEFAKIFAGLISILRLAINIAKGVIKVIAAIGAGMSEGTGGLLYFISQVAEVVTFLIWSAIESGKVAAVFNGLAKVVGFVASIFGKLVAIVASVAWFVLSNVLKGILNIFKLMWIPISAVGTAIKTIFAAGTPAAEAAKAAFQGVKDAISSITGASEGTGKTMEWLRDVFTSFANWIVDKLPSSETFAKAFGSIGDFFEKVILKIGSIIPALDDVKSAFGPVGDFFEKLWGTANSGVGFIANIANAILIFFGVIRDAIFSTTVPMDQVSKNFDQAGNNMEKFKAFMEGLVTGIKTFAQTIWNIFAWIGNLFSSIFDVENVGKVGDFIENNWGKIVVGALLLIFNRITKTIQTFVGPKGPIQNLWGLRDLTGNIDNFIDDLKKSFGNSSVIDQITKGALRLAAAIAIFTLSVWLLSRIPKDDLNKGLVAVGEGLLAVTAIMTALWASTKKLDGGSSLVAMGTAIIAISFAMLILAAAVKLFGMMDEDQVSQGITSISLLITMLGAFAFAMGQTGSLKGMLGLGAGLVLLAVALNILIIPIKVLGSMDWNVVKQGLTSIALMLFAIAAAVVMMRYGDPMAVGAGLLLLSFALGKLTKVVLALSEIEWGTFLSGLTKMALMLATFAAIFRIMPKETDIVKLGAGLLVMSAAIYVIAKALEILATIKLATIMISTLAIVLLIQMLAVTAKEIDNSVEGIVGVLALAAALYVMSTALSMIAALDIKSVLYSTVALLGLIIMLAIAANSMSAAGAGAASMVAMSLALVFMANAIKSLAELSIAQIVTGIVALAASLLILVGVGVLMASFGPVTAVAVAALLSFAAVALIFGVAADLLTRAFVRMAKNSEAGSKALVQVLTTLILFLPRLMTSLAVGFVQMIATFLGSVPMLVDALRVTLMSILTLIIEVAPKFAEAGIAIMSALLTGFSSIQDQLLDTLTTLLLGVLVHIRDNIGEFTTLGADIMINFMNGLASRIPELATSAANLIVTILTAIGDHINEIQDAGYGVLIKFINGISDNLSDISKAIAGLISRFITEIAANWQQIIDSGAEALGKFIEGLIKVTTKVTNDIVELITKIAKQMASAVLELTKELTDIAVNFLHGIGLAISDGTPRIIKELKFIMGSLVKGIASAIVPGELSGIGESIAQGVLKAAAGPLGWIVNSPSKAFYRLAKAIPEGIVKALDEDTTAAVGAQELAGRTLTSFQKSVANINNVIDTMDDFNPTVTPVLNLDNVETEAKRLTSILGDHAFNADISVQNADTINALSRNLNSTPEPAPQPEAPREVVFNQTVNSPDPLSTRDIYNATRSQIQMAKEELSLL